MHYPSDRNLPKGPAMSPYGFIKEAVRLKFETDRSDHSKDCISSFRHIDQDLYSQTLFLQNTLESHRQDETNEFHLLQSNIEQALHLVRKDIGNKDDLEEEDKEYYQRYLNDLYGKINIFKALGGRAWDYILDEEMKLTREIDRSVSEMESWEGDMPQERLPRWKSSRPFSASLPITASKEEGGYSDVQVFRNFLIQYGGRSGGWKTNDHTQFMKILNKYKGELERAKNEIHSLFPDKSENDIISHYRWYKKYKVLKRNHLKALENWKIKQKDEIEEIKDMDETVLEEKKPTQKNNYAREEEKARIRSWKERKQLEEEEMRKTKEKEKMDEQERCRFELKQKRQMLARLLKENQERQVAPPAEEVHPPAQVEDRRRPRTTPTERMRHFQQQDREHIARLLELRNRRKSPAKDKEQETQWHGKISVSRERDPSRVFQTTKSTRARSRPCVEDLDNFPKAFQPVPNIRKVPKLKIPEWRKNENLKRNQGGDHVTFK